MYILCGTEIYNTDMIGWNYTINIVVNLYDSERCKRN